MPATSGAGKRLIVVQSTQIAGSPGSTTPNALVAWSASDGSAVKNTGVVYNPNTNDLSNLASVASKQPADYLQSDGATTNRRIETQYGALGAVAGSDLTEVDCVFDVPTSNVTTQVYLFAWVTSSITAANRLVGYLQTTGSLEVVQFGATDTDFRGFTYSGFRAAYSGRRVRVTVALPGNGTGNPTVWIDGVDVSSNFSASTSGTPPNWVSTSLPTSYYQRGYNWPAGYFRPGRPVNRKYAQSDVDFVQVTGKLPYSDAAGGSMTNRQTGTFANGSPGYDTFSGGTTTGFTAVKTTTGSPAYANGAAGYTFPASAIVSVAFDLTLTSGVAPSVTLLNSGLTQQSAAAGHNVLYFRTTSSFSGFVQFVNGSSDNTNYTVANVLVTVTGALSDPIIQRCNVLDDATPNNKASLLVGFNPVTPKKDWRIPAYVDMSSTGNKQLLAGAVFDTPTAQAIDTIETTCAGTPTFSVGDGTTATKYTASVAHSAGRLRETLSANFPADSAKTGLYANVTVTGGTSELVIVRGHRE